MANAGLGLSPVVRDRGGRTSDRVFDELVSAIRDLRLPPGRLLSEAELAVELQVSRTPLREALARLADAGLLQVLPQVGTLVARIRMRDAEEARFIRESLETAAFDLACARAVRDVSKLRAVLAAQRAAADKGDMDAFFTADEALHAGIFEMSGFPGAWTAVQRSKFQLDRLRRLSLPDTSTVDDLIDEHTWIVDALEAGDSVGGQAHIRRHARRVLEFGPRLRVLHPDYFVDEPATG